MATVTNLLTVQARQPLIFSTQVPLHLQLNTAQYSRIYKVIIMLPAARNAAVFNSFFLSISPFLVGGLKPQLYANVFIWLKLLKQGGTFTNKVP